ncbi:Uncharacterised protein [Candidatus Anstonella stagnisolia]|nr:Uncharacterised protein [Candidatus Anstonella stagnisolia]
MAEKQPKKFKDGDALTAEDVNSFVRVSANELTDAAKRKYRFLKGREQGSRNFILLTLTAPILIILILSLGSKIDKFDFAFFIGLILLYFIFAMLVACILIFVAFLIKSFFKGAYFHLNTHKIDSFDHPNELFLNLYETYLNCEYLDEITTIRAIEELKKAKKNVKNSIELFYPLLYTNSIVDELKSLTMYIEKMDGVLNSTEKDRVKPALVEILNALAMPDLKLRDNNVLKDLMTIRTEQRDEAFLGLHFPLRSTNTIRLIYGILSFIVAFFLSPFFTDILSATGIFPYPKEIVFPVLVGMLWLFLTQVIQPFIICSSDSNLPQQ